MFGTNSKRAARSTLRAFSIGAMLGWAALPSARAQGLVLLTTANVAFGGKELASPVSLPSTSEYIGLLSIANVALPTVKESRALLQGALSVKSAKGSGKALVRVRMTINGVPEQAVWSTTLPDGGAATVSIQCNDIIAQTGTYTYALQASVVGSGKAMVEAGDFHLIAIPTPQVPIP
jgi:hypothetical protein